MRKHRLREIERAPEREDPEFARRIAAPGGQGVAVWANAILLSGVLLAIVGLLAGSAFGGLGLLLIVIGLTLRLAAPVFTEPPPSDDDGGGSNGGDSVRA